MVLPVDVAPIQDRPIACDCTLDQPPDHWRGCFDGDGFCGDQDFSSAGATVAHVEGWRPDTGTLVWRIRTNSIDSLALLVEVDIERMRARACLVASIDYRSARPVAQCAMRGSVTLSDTPETADDVGDTWIRVQAEFDEVRFDDVTPFRIRDVTLDFTSRPRPPRTFPRY